MANVLSDNEGSIITKKENISQKVKMEDPNLRYSSLSRKDEQVITNRKRSNVSTMRSVAVDLKNIK